MPPLSPIEARCFKEAPDIAHGFFTRAGGASRGLYASLNCGVGSKDDRSLVLENRGRIAAHLGTSRERLLTCFQTHSADTAVVTRPWTLGDMPRADAMVTRERGIGLGVLAADCAPVLFADREAGVIGAAHAGWRGALGGILESTIAAMEGLGARRERIRAALGPCIGPEAYEVGPEFEMKFLADTPGNARFFHRSVAAARPRFDLPAYVLSRLGQSGLGTVEPVTQCTYMNEASFFSFRRTTHRQEPGYGRQISAIVLR
jgi:YfiH family protein